MATVTGITGSYGEADLHDVSILWARQDLGKGIGKVPGKRITRSADKTISLYNCRNVTIRDHFYSEGGWFAILATGVDNLTIDNIKLDTERDGMDIDCCKNVWICDCYVNSPYDDGICLKSTFGLGYARATENVTITGARWAAMIWARYWMGLYAVG